MMAMLYSFSIIMFLDHLFHKIKECIDIQVGIVLVFIYFAEVVKDPFIVFCYHCLNDFSSCKNTTFF